MNHQGSCELDGKKKKKKMQEDEDPEQPQEQRQQIVTAPCQDSTKSNSLPSLPVASCSDQGQDENASAAGGASGASNREKSTVEAGHGGGEGGGLPARRHWWGDCQPHVVLLREALLSSAPDIAVLGPLHGCFAFYVTHLHNEVLSSTYARTMTLGPNVTRLESAFMWVGGWRPTSALVLVYSLMGIDIENALQAVRAGRDVGDRTTSSLLSTRQLAVMHSLQKHTQHAEMKITKKLSVLQMLIGDQDMLEAVLLDAASPVANDSSRFHQAAEKRMSRFRRLLVQAEELRLHTLKDLLSLLTPIQAARCGVAVFEVCSTLRTMGSTVLPTLPAFAVALPVAIPPLPPAPSGLVGNTLVAGSGEPIDLDLSSSEGTLNPYDFPRSYSHDLLVSDLSTSDSILDTSDVTFSQSYEPLVSDASSSPDILNASDVLLGQSDETAILVPSCSNSSSLRLLPQDSSQDFDREESTKSLAVVLPLEDLKLDDDANGMVPDRNEQRPRVGKSEGKVISNRLFILSPASSDVTIQNCSLETSEGPFEMRPQVLVISDDAGESSEVQPEPSESGDMGGSCHIQQGVPDCHQLTGHISSRMSAPCECARQGSQSNEGS